MDFPCTLSKALDQLNSIGCRLLSADEEPGLRFFDAAFGPHGEVQKRNFMVFTSQECGFRQENCGIRPQRRTNCTPKHTGNETAPFRSTTVFIQKWPSEILRGE